MIAQQLEAAGGLLERVEGLRRFALRLAQQAEHAVCLVGQHRRLRGGELVEGGAAGLLGSHAVKVVMFEFGSANVNSRTFFRDFWDLLTGFGYRIERIIPGGGTLAVRRYAEDLEYFRGATNYVARIA